jgi:DNA-binding Lrp family transcriptional regulator
MLDATDHAIVNLLQHGLEVCEQPFAAPAARLGLDQAALIARVQRLLDDGVLTRVGPMFDAERLGGAFTLCAMRVPAPRFDEVTTLVNAFDEVAHNYAREHEYNMWFVIGAASAGRVHEVIAQIEARSALPVLDLPKLEEFYIGLHLEA